ncbi:tyrosine-type recombinase/integrase [Tropicimonas sediminicola]|uniref:Phage integrase family protein n=1 Tax=Tropicimonas sediminicola TaxID=1031541 RepID=A0A239M7P7_9RHOB|nr:integrase family protein [Tropicimonas sediminicola]SNT38168.1 Phage integrase family protein [Tropicimonas sediminicola]
MAEDRVKLTKTTVAKIEPAEGKQLLVWDSELRGFGLRVSPGGAKAFIMQRRVGKNTRRVTIGRAGDMTPEAARKRALTLASQFADGIDPVAERKRQEARSMTLRDAFEDYMRAPKKKGGGRGAPKKARTIRDIEKCMRRFDDWLDKPVTEITGSMVKKRHAEIVETSPAQANLAFRYLRAAFNHVIADADDDRDALLSRNPVDRLNRLNQWAEVKPAKGHIPEGKLADWIEAVQTGLVGLKNENEARDALLFMLLTGARLAEALGNPLDGYQPLAWSDVDLERRIVVFRNTKNRTDHELPLGSELASLLKARKAVSGPDFVFSNPNGALPTDLRSAYHRIEAKTGLYVTAHDLRRTFATVASKLDISAYKLKRLTNHISGGDVTAGYVQVTTEDLRDAMQRIEDYMLSPGRTADVVQLEARR